MHEKILIQKIATKYNLPIKTVENIVYSQFKFVADIIKEGQMINYDKRAGHTMLISEKPYCQPKEHLTFPLWFQVLIMVK